MEAVLATDESDEAAAAWAGMHRVYNTLNRRLNSRHFFIGMTVRGAPATPPPGRSIQAFLEAHLKGLNVDALAQLQVSFGMEALPHWRYEHAGWHLDFFPIPKPLQLRGRTDIRPLGAWIRAGDDHGMYPINTRVAIRDVIVRKAGRYGAVEFPYVIAVNAFGDHAHQLDMHLDALFGQAGWISTMDASGNASGPLFSRARDGVWTSESGSRYSRVSAVLLVTLRSP